MTRNESKLQPSQRLRIAYLLTLAGGYLDAYTYFERGGVFANAQTGNIVKLGIELADAAGTPKHATSYLIPILAFVAGLVASLAVAELLDRRGVRLVRRAVLMVEMAGLAVVAFIPLGVEWDVLANSIVSFVAAMQYETFSTFRGAAIATTMSTGNLRKMVDSLFAAIVRGESEKLHQAGIFASIVGVFALGAFVGTRCCGLMGRVAVVPVIVLLGLAVVVITILRERNLAQLGVA